MPSWFDIAPRLGVSYDLFGNGRPRSRRRFGRYMAGQTTSFPARYNPLQLQSDTRTWRDPNGDNIAQDNEIGASNNAAFGLPVHDDPARSGHEARIRPRVHGVRCSTRSSGACRCTSASTAAAPTTSGGPRTSAGTPSDYTIVNVVSPLDGQVLPVYNLNPAKRGNVDRLDFNSTDSDLRSRSYNGIQLGLQRARAGAPVLRRVDDRPASSTRAAMRSRATRPATRAPLPSRRTTRRNPTSTGATRAQLDIPFLHEIKLAGSYTLPWYGIQANVAFQSYNGQPLFTRWNISPTTRYAANCEAPCRPGELVIPNMTLASYVLDLVAPGQEYYDRQNQFDMGFRKLFRVRPLSDLRRRSTSSTS